MDEEENNEDVEELDAEQDFIEESSSDEVRALNIATAREGELDALPTMRLVDERTATLFGQELGHAFQCQVDVSVESVDIQRASEWSANLERPGCFNLVEVEALSGHAMLCMQQELFFRLLELLFGAGSMGQNPFGSNARKRFSSVEERVIRRIVHLFGRSMEAAWRPVIPMHVVHLRIEAKPENAPISDRDDWLIITTYAVKMGDFTGQISMALPKAGLMKFRERLSTGRYEKRPEHKENWTSTLAASMRGIDVDVVAHLGQAELTLGELLELKAGQVLRLDTSPEQPLTIHVADVPKYTGHPTVQHGNIAITIENFIF